MLFQDIGSMRIMIHISFHHLFKNDVFKRLFKLSNLLFEEIVSDITILDGVNSRQVMSDIVIILDELDFLYSLYQRELYT